MNLIDRIFSSKKDASNKILIYLNTDFKQSIEVEDQPVRNYLEIGST
jgi:hypothetical protein